MHIQSDSTQKNSNIDGKIIEEPWWYNDWQA